MYIIYVYSDLHSRMQQNMNFVFSSANNVNIKTKKPVIFLKVCVGVRLTFRE
jgi:hypothetical protein